MCDDVSLDEADADVDSDGTLSSQSSLSVDVIVGRSGTRNECCLVSFSRARLAILAAEKRDSEICGINSELPTGVFWGGIGIGGGRPGWRWLRNSGDVSVLSDCRNGGGLGGCLKDLFAVSINWGANFCRLLLVDDSKGCGRVRRFGGLSSSADSGSAAPFLLLLRDDSTGSGRNLLRGGSSGVSFDSLCRRLLVVVSTGSGVKRLEDFVVLSMGCGRTLRVGECDDLVEVSIGSGTNFLFGRSWAVSGESSCDL